MRFLWGVGGMEQPIFHRDYCARLEGFRYNLPRFGLKYTSKAGPAGLGLRVVGKRFAFMSALVFLGI